MLLLSYARLREIAEESGRRPRLHPNGFVQFDLTPWGNLRLHVWPDSPIPAQKTRHPIHDHCFDMTSTVIAGTLSNYNYKFVPGIPKPSDAIPIQQYNYRIYRAQQTGEGQNTVLVEDDGILGHLSTLRADVLRPGNQYSVAAGILHESKALGLTATICERFGITKYQPRVAVPDGVQPDNDFRREDIDPEILWEQIFHAIKVSPVVREA